MGMSVLLRYLSRVSMFYFLMSWQSSFALLQDDSRAEVVGSVRNITDSTPVAGAQVSCGKSMAVSSTNGTFRLTNLNGRPCSLKIAADGYFQDPRSNPIVKAYSGTEPKEIVVDLIPASKLSGSVRTREKQPIEGATVYLLAIRRSSKVRSLYSIKTTSTTKDGSFAIENIQPGTYFLLCSPPKNPVGKTVLSPTYFPSSVNDLGAAPIALRPGETQFGLDLEVQRERVYSISGLLISQDRVADISKSFSLDLLRRGDREKASVTVDPVRAPLPSPYSRILLSGDGQFLIEGVISGSYELVLKSKLSSSGQPVSRIEVAGRDVVGLKVDLLAPSRVSGRAVVRTENDASQKSNPLPSTISLSNPEVVDETSTVIQIQKDGSFRVPALAPGKYEAYLFAGSRQANDLYLDSIEWNGVAQANLSFVNAGFPDNTLILKFDSGRATIQATAPTDATKVILFPTPLREIDSLRGGVVLGEPNADGLFRLSRIIPGTYALCAVDSLEGGNFSEWVNDPSHSKSLEKYCRRVEVKKNDSISVQLPLLAFSKER